MNAFSKVSDVVFVLVFSGLFFVSGLLSMKFNTEFYYAYVAIAMIFPFIIPELSALKTKKGQDSNVNILNVTLFEIVASTFTLPRNFNGILKSAVYNAITLFQLLCFNILIVFPFSLFITETSDLLYPVSIITISLAGLVYSYYKTENILIKLALFLIVPPGWAFTGVMFIISALLGKWFFFKGKWAFLRGTEDISSAKSRGVLVFSGALLIFGCVFVMLQLLQPIILWTAALIIGFMNAYAMTKLAQA